MLQPVLSHPKVKLEVQQNLDAVSAASALSYKRTASLNESGCSPTPLGSFNGDRIRGFVSAERGIVLWVLPKIFGEGRRKEIVGRVGPLLVSPQSSIMLVENTFAQ